MHETWAYIGCVLSVIIAIVTIAKFLFYTKSEINAKLEDHKKESDKRDELLLEKVNESQNEIKES